MTSMTKEFGHLSQTLVWRGAAMLALGLAAVVWPEQILILAMLIVGIVATVFGLYEISIAFAIRRRAPRWWLVLVHGVTSIAFGGLSVGSPSVSLRVALIVIAIWFLVYAGLAFSAAILIRSFPFIRRALLTWGFVDVGLAIVTLLFPAMTIFAVLFGGAVYAALFGAWQLAAGLWLRRAVRHHRPSLEGRFVVAQ